MFLRVVSVLGLTMVLLATASCSGDDDADTTSSTASTTTEATSESTTSTTVVLSDDEFTDVADSITGEVEAAEGDFCQLMGLVTLEPMAQPTTPQQVEAAVNVLAGLFLGLANAEGVDAESAAVLREMAEVLPPQAEASGWSVDFLTSPETPFVANETYVGTLTALGLRASEECSEPEGESTD